MFCSQRITGEDCTSFARAFRKAKALKRIHLCGNPLTQTDIKQILSLLRKGNKLEILSFGECTRFTKENMKIVAKIMEKFPEFCIIYDSTSLERPPKTIDFTAILIDRCRFLCKKPKNPKLKKDLGHFFLYVLDSQPPFCPKEAFIKLLLEFNKKLERSMADQIAVDWLEKLKKKKKIDTVRLHAMAKYYLERYPTERPPPPPLPKEKVIKKAIETKKKRGKQGIKVTKK